MSSSHVRPFCLQYGVNCTTSSTRTYLCCSQHSCRQNHLSRTSLQFSVAFVHALIHAAPLCFTWMPLLSPTFNFLTFNFSPTVLCGLAESTPKHCFTLVLCEGIDLSSNIMRNCAFSPRSLCFGKIWTAVQRQLQKVAPQEFFSLSKYDSP